MGRVFNENRIIMKITKKGIPGFLLLIFLTLFTGTIFWKILELILTSVTGSSVSLTTSPLGFDLGVVALYFRFNPGSLIGFIAGVVLYKRI